MSNHRNADAEAEIGLCLLLAAADGDVSEREIGALSTRLGTLLGDDFPPIAMGVIADAEIDRMARIGPDRYVTSLVERIPESRRLPALRAALQVADADGLAAEEESMFHDVARALGMSAAEARTMLGELRTGMNDPRRFSPSTARNREPILEALRRFVQKGARVLEVASGSGEHAIFLAPRLGVVRWQPSDPDPAARASIDAWRAHEAETSTSVLETIPAALDLDLLAPTKDTWPTDPVELVACINMVHISPWDATLALLEGAARVLTPDGRLYLYGPYRRAGVATALSNEAFDASLRARNGAWGLRAVEDLLAAADARGLILEDLIEMPANNLSLLLRRRTSDLTP